MDDFDDMYYSTRCVNRCETCVLPTLTDEQRRKRRVYLLWLLARGFPTVCGDVLRVILMAWCRSESSPAFTTFTLRCAVHIYRTEPWNATVKSWGPIQHWDTRNVTNFDSLFQNDPYFNERLSWDTRNARSMTCMFAGARSFNQPVNFRFDNVRLTDNMFRNATAFNQPFTVRHAPHWQSARQMFRKATSLNATVFCNAPKLVDVFNMFCDAHAFRAAVVLTTVAPRINVSLMDLPEGARVRVGNEWYRGARRRQPASEYS